MYVYNLYVQFFLHIFSYSCVKTNINFTEKDVLFTCDKWYLNYKCYCLIYNEKRVGDSVCGFRLFDCGF